MQVAIEIHNQSSELCQPWQQEQARAVPSVSPSTLCPKLLDLHPEPADLARLATSGLNQPLNCKRLPSWFLYDELGSHLFDRICATPEYTLYKTEIALLHASAADLVSVLQEREVGALVEFGAGSSHKVGALLRAFELYQQPQSLKQAQRQLQQPVYVALDICGEHLLNALNTLQSQFTTTPMLGIACDFTQTMQLPEHQLLPPAPVQVKPSTELETAAASRPSTRVGFFPGSTLGNFAPHEARQLLYTWRGLLGGAGARLIIGIDQPKAVDRLEAAYDDAEGVSAEFALNLLTRLNRDVGTDFDLSSFRYRARWQAAESRIEMALISQTAQSVTIAGAAAAHFEKGEALITEYSYKYDATTLRALAVSAGWRCTKMWTDPAGDVALHLLEADDFAREE